MTNNDGLNRLYGVEGTRGGYLAWRSSDWHLLGSWLFLSRGFLRSGDCTQLVLGNWLRLGFD